MIRAPQDLGPDHQALRQTYIRKVGDTLNLLIPFQGKPQPQAICTHDGCALDASHVSMWNGERDSILFIREAQRADSGHYQLRVQLGGLEATATIDTLVIGTVGGMGDDVVLGGSHPSLKRNQHREPGKRGCGTQWWRYPGVDSAPRHGNALLGYTVQKADTKSGLWLTALERHHRASCTVSNLIVGNSYALRVFAENQCGLSQTASVTADLAHIQRAEAPKFSQPLADCTTVIGCDTQLFCCVHAYPKPKTIWLKNKMDIQGNPKYRALIHLGICSLEIHKPGPFDGGIYTCKAVNPLGEASVDCRVDVKVPFSISPSQCQQRSRVNTDFRAQDPGTMKGGHLSSLDELSLFAVMATTYPLFSVPPGSLWRDCALKELQHSVCLD
ncbi:Myosin-binding protein H-like, partial [Eschrichtius robustus]|nr:Myosin-binding protein H-like [Eschrichtius robustus]